MRWRRVTMAATMLLVLTAGSAGADVEVDDTSISFRGLSGETIVRTLNLRVTTDKSTVTFIRHDLLDKTTGRALPASAIAIDPPKIENASVGIQQVKVSVTLPARAATYEGNLGIESGKSKDSVTLVATVDPTPAVTVSPATLVMRLRMPLNDLAFAGDPTSTKDGRWEPAKAKGAFDLQQAGTSAAAVESMKVVGLRQADGDTLPAGAVTISDVRTVPARDSASVDATVKGRNLPAGEYSGTIAIAIKDQPTIVTLPFTLKVKDGPLLAFLLMVGGIGVALAFTYWSGKGSAYIEASRQIQRLADGVEGKGGQLPLPADEHDEALRRLKQAATAIDGGLPPADVTVLIKAASDYIDGFRAKVNEQLADLIAAEKDARARKGEKLIEVYVGRTRAQGDALRNGSASSITAAAQEVSAIKGDIAEWTKAEADFDKLPAEEQGKRLGELNAAASLSAYKKVITGVMPPTVTGGLVAGTETKSPEVSVKTLGRLELVERLIWVLTFVFVLALGWITLYLAADTFGADAKDYLSVFLWGTVTSSVFGKAVGFGELKKLAFPNA